MRSRRHCFEPNPKHRYMVTPNQDEAEWATSSLIGQPRAVETRGKPYTYRP